MLWVPTRGHCPRNGILPEQGHYHLLTHAVSETLGAHHTYPPPADLTPTHSAAAYDLVSALKELIKITKIKVTDVTREKNDR